MPAQPPILDTRLWNDLLAELQAEAAVDLPQWTPSSQGDAGVMVQRIFARFMEIALERLNRAPEKNLLAFLDAMGVSTLSPTAAQAPLTFSLLKNSPPTLIPKGTQAGTKPGGHSPTLTFETTQDFTVLPAQLASAFTIDPVWDRYADQSVGAAGEGPIPFTPFVGTERMPHVLYVGDDALLNFSHPATAVVSFSWPNDPSGDVIRQLLGQFLYQYWAQGVLTSVPAATVSVEVAGAQVQVTLPLPAGVDLTSVQGLGLAQPVESRWLQAVLTVPLPDCQPAQELTVSKLTLGVSSAASFSPDLAFSDNAPLDLTKEFFPFGQTPGVGSTFYIASQDAFAKPGSTATFSFSVVPVETPVVLWEYWDGSKWSQLPAGSVFDGTQSFTQNGLISLVVPAPVPSGGPAGGAAAWSNVWVRARLTAGSYRGAPSIPSFNVITSTKLVQPTTAQANSIVIDTSNLLMDGNVMQFGGPGQVIQVDNDYSLVTSVNGATVNLSPALQNVHNVGAPVTLLLTTPAAKAATAISAGATQIIATPAGQVSAGNVLLIDDIFGPEFVTVKQVQTATDATGAIIPGDISITLTQTTKAGHASGVSLAIVAPMNVLTFADNTWMDATQEFYPLGKSPGAGDFFVMYTFGGFFAAFSAEVEVRKVASPPSNAPKFADVKPAAAAGASLPAAAFPRHVTLNPALDIKNAAAFQAFETVSLSGGAGVSLGGWNLYTNPFFYTPQLCINVSVTVKENFPPLSLAWEYLNSNGWQPIDVPDANANKFLIDGPGSLVLALPDCGPGSVNNQKGYWVRARIANGNYGVPLTYVAVDPADPSKGYQIQSGSGNLHPPILSNVGLQYTVTRTPPELLTRNGFLYADETVQNSSFFAPFVAVTELPPIAYSDPEPAFYLGFDTAFPQEPVTLWVDAAPRSFAGSVVKEVSVAPSLEGNLPALRWEYFNGTAWSSLPVLDQTNDLTQSGTLEFLTPVDLAPLARFDANLRYWIRARSSQNDPFNTQQIGGMYLNAIPSIQAVMVSNEILGSSNGQSGQTFNFVRTPILAGQQVLVREPEQPSGVEAATLQSEEGIDAIQQVFNTVTQQSEVWVRWHEVENFLASEPIDRHYTLDHSSGLLTFGDGQQGIIPPTGTQNITASCQTGGGASGNVPAGAIAQVKSKVAGVASVSNPVAADGGADTETVAGVEDRGPQVMKHRGHAVAARDIEWLAREAAGTRVARAQCLPNVNRELSFEPGWVTLLIVPAAADAKPSPSSELLLQVENYLTSRAFVGLSQQIPARVNVIGPGYIQVTVIAQVVPADLEEAEPVKQAVLQALEAYLHPLTGGPLGTGWNFGSSVYASKVNRLIEGIAGVDHVTALQLLPNLAQHRLEVDASAAGGSYIPEGAVVVTPDGRKSGLMAEGSDTSTGVLLVKGFKERDPIARVTDLKVVSVSGTWVTVTATDGSVFNADSLGMPRGSVVMKFDGSASTRLAEGILPNQENVASILLETPLGAESDILTLFYPFPMTVSTVSVDAVTLAVTGISLQPAAPSGLAVEKVETLSGAEAARGKIRRDAAALLTFRTAGAIISVAPFSTDVAVPEGTLVVSLDGTRQSPLVEGFTAGQAGITQLSVLDPEFATSFSPGDAVLLQIPSQTLGIDPYEPEFDFPDGSVMATLDNRVRLPLLDVVPGGATATSIRLADFASGDIVAPRGSASAGLTVVTLEPVFDVVDLDPNFLVYSGAHRITMVEE